MSNWLKSQVHDLPECICVYVCMNVNKHRGRHWHLFFKLTSNDPYVECLLVSEISNVTSQFKFSCINKFIQLMVDLCYYIQSTDVKG